jgi:hypothetical protein
MNLGITLVTVVMSGVVAAVVTYRLNTTKEHVFFMRKKGEELYLAAETFDRSLSSYFLPGYSVVKGEISWNEFLDLTIENANKSDNEASRQVLMLVDIYFPQLQPAFDKYLEQRTTLNGILHEHKRAFKAGTVGTEFFKPFHQAMGELDVRAKEFKQAMIIEIRKFATSGPLWSWKQP